MNGLFEDEICGVHEINNINVIREGFIFGIRTLATRKMATPIQANFGRLNEYDASISEWKDYIEQLEQFFLANDVDDGGKKRAILLSSGSKTYSLIRNLVAPDRPSDKSFDQLVELMEKHVNQIPSIIVERFKFYKRDCVSTETVATYISELKKLSRTC